MATIFSDTDTVLDGLGGASTAALVAAVADVSLVLDEEGAIVDLSVENEELGDVVPESWRGRKWMDTLVPGSRDKARELMDHMAAPGQPLLWRELSHRTPDGAEFAIRYCAIPLGTTGRRVVLGRELRALTVLKQQLLNAQQALEQDYWRLRQVETRYRLLFQMAEDAVLIVDEASGRVLEANPAAGRLLGGERRSVVGQAFPLGLDAEATEAVGKVLAEARTMGQATATVQLAQEEGARSLTIAANLIRDENEARFLVRLSGAAASPAAGVQPRYDDLIKQSPDAVVLTDTDGIIRAANPVFVSLAQLATAEQAVGQSLERWLGRSGVDLNVLLSNLRRHGAVRLFSTTLKSEYDGQAEVEISAASFASGEEPLFGIFMREVGRRVKGGGAAVNPLARSVEQLTERVGKVPLKELVRESTDLIERLCIEAALELTNNNRASAAELLGLSRQSLYAKLRRYDLGDFEVEEGD